MCGIAGFYGLAAPAAALREIALAMAERLVHRGPDDAGAWVDAGAGVGLSHRRLAILDLSPTGRQPMESPSGRFVVVFNGEIYNHADLRHELETASATGAEIGVRWRGSSDTEVMLAAFDAWGIERALKRLIGMFAFAVWDRETHSLTLARDRVGEKPLYYGWSDGTFIFGSELKALKAFPGFRPEIDRNSLSLLLRHNYIPAPHTIYRDFRKLPPGNYLTLKSGQPNASPSSYWSVRDVAIGGQSAPFPEADGEAVEELETLLRRAVAAQMAADVPLGAFLSGGIDSSTVVALMQAQSSRPVKTFTIGFREKGYDEAQHAQAVAAYLGTEHTELYVTPEEAMAVIPRLPSLYDEPFADSSQIPTLLVSQLARRHVTVSLSGDGGDELFGGYNRYFWAANLWRRVGRLPPSLRSVLAGILTALPPACWNSVMRKFAVFAPPGWRYANPGDKLHKLAEILAMKTPDEIYLGLVSHWKQPGGLVSGAEEPATVLTDPANRTAFPSFEQRMMYLDAITYLPDDILVKVDRAAMAVSLETRVPFLDHRVVEFAWRLPLSMKIRAGTGKWLLRQVLRRYLPQQLIERPKMGFGIPLDAWLRGPLRDWAEALIDESRLKTEGFFDPAPVRQKWAEHRSGQRNWSYHLWDVLMFQAWLEAQ